MRPRLMTAAVAALLVVALAGCSEHDQGCTQDYLACNTGCDLALSEAEAAQQPCLDACEAANSSAGLECAALADDQLAYLQCTLAANQALLACTTACIDDYARAFTAWEGCRQTCQSDYQACLNAD